MSTKITTSLFSAILVDYSRSIEGDELDFCDYKFPYLTDWVLRGTRGRGRDQSFRFLGAKGLINILQQIPPLPGSLPPGAEDLSLISFSPILHA